MARIAAAGTDSRRPGAPEFAGAARSLPNRSAHAARIVAALHYIARTPFPSFAIFILAWWGVALSNGNPVQLPTPLAVFRALLASTEDGELFDNASISMLRLVISMAVALAVALPLGLLLGLSGRARAFIDPTIEMLRPVSGIAWIPLGLFIFGVGNVLPVFIMSYVAFFPLLLSTVAGVAGTDPKLVAAARTMGVGHWRIVRHVVVPAALPTIMVGLRLGFAGGWAAIIAAELIGAPSGLGFAIEWYRELLATSKVFAYIAVIAVTGYVCDFALQALQWRLTPWAAESTLS